MDIKMNKLERIMSFLEEYTRFFEEMVEAEKVKLNILLSSDLKAIEENILVQQVNAKRIENMEKRRIGLFNEIGHKNQSLKEIIESYEENKYELSQYYNRIDKSIELIKHFNKKSLELIRFNLSMSEIRNDIGLNYDMKGTR